MSEHQAAAYDPTEMGKGEAPDQPEIPALVDEDGNELPTFDPKYAEDFVGLLYLGALTDSFTWLGHHFIIRTLRDGEILAVAQIIKPYMDTMGVDRAYAMAIAAISIVSVDGQELPIPIGESKRINEWGHQRFEYVRDNWFPYTTTQVYNRYLMLDDLVRQVVEALGKASAPEDSTPSSNAI
jgi:hypothetical protein